MGFRDVLSKLFGGREKAGAPRDHHYFYAHRVLPTLAFRDTIQTLDILRSENGLDFLTGLWHDMGRQLRARDRLPPDGLQLEMRRDGKYLYALVTLPPPLYSPEAYMVALQFESELLAPRLRYFALELGYLDPAGPRRTVLCEWTAEPAHLNFGDGPPPEVEAFYQRLRDMTADDDYQAEAQAKSHFGPAAPGPVTCVDCGAACDSGALPEADLQLLQQQRAWADLKEEHAMLGRVQALYAAHPQLEEQVQATFIERFEGGPGSREMADTLGDQVIVLRPEEPSAAPALPEGEWTDDERATLAFLRTHYFRLGPRREFVEAALRDLEEVAQARVACPACGSGRLVMGPTET